MHRTDGDANYPAGYFSEGDPGIPRLPTQIAATWLNDVQEELVSVALGAGLALIKGTAQLGAVVANLNVAQTFSALKTFSKGLLGQASTSGPGVDATSGLGGHPALRAISTASGGGAPAHAAELGSDSEWPSLVVTNPSGPGIDFDTGQICMRVPVVDAAPPSTAHVGDIWFGGPGTYYLWLCVGSGVWKKVELT